MSVEEALALPVTVDLVDAGRAFGLNRTKTYELAAAGKFPVELERYGRRYVVYRSTLLAKLGIADPTAVASVHPIRPTGLPSPRRASDR